MPTLGDMVERVYRDLADEPRVVFTQVQVEDFVRAGIVEIGRAAPVERYDDIVFVDQTYEYPVDLKEVYRVAIRDPEGNETGTFPMIEPVPWEAPYSIQYGYRFVTTGDGGKITIPKVTVDTWMEVTDTERPSLRAYGYGPHATPYTTQVLSDPDDPGSPLVDLDPETGLSSDEEYAVREYAKAQGFDMLTHDRSLFAQWQGQTNNTDVSPVMMMNMALSAQSNWQRRRGLIRVVRRQW